jgi:thiol:disulfide interchange protein DsbD
LFIFGLLTSSPLLHAQIGPGGGGGSVSESPVKWTNELEPAQDSYQPGETVTLRMRAKIPGKWHVYSQKPSESGVYNNAKLRLHPSTQKHVSRAGELQEEGKLIEEYDDLMEGDMRYFNDRVVFVQKLKIEQAGLQAIKGKLKYQACEFEKYNVCLQEENAFTLAISVEQASGAAGPAHNTQAPAEQSPTPDEQSSPTADKDKQTPKPQAQAQAPKTPAESGGEGNAETESTTDAQDARAGSSTPEKPDRSLVISFLAALGAGFAALITPCVFPMIPMTVSFFTKRASDRKKGIRDAMIYVFSIILMFTLVGLIITMTVGESALYAISINPYVNLVFFALLVIFALSFFGMFDITLPNNMINKMDRMSDRGGFIGIFFMAATLVVASFSCTGPLIGSALVTASQTGNIMAPTIIMLGFSMGFGLPFGVFATFPGMLNTMPKSGGWLNTVKVTLGFLELALSLKFLSIADLSWGSGFLDRDIFLALWIVIFALLGLYLLGKIRLPHDMPLEKISVPRMMLALMSFAFVIYMLPGMFGSPLSPLAGFLPPPKQEMGVSVAGGGYNGSGGENNARLASKKDPVCKLDRKYAEELAEATPKGFCAFYDLEEARQYAKKVNKPLFIDFTGHTCANCRDVEQRIWAKPKVKRILQEQYVMVSLFVDDNTQLEEPETTEDGYKVRTVGEKWRKFQGNQYGKISQPYYVLTDPQMNELTEPMGYTSNPKKYLDFLRTGLREYEPQEQPINSQAAAAEIGKPDPTAESANM